MPTILVNKVIAGAFALLVGSVLPQLSFAQVPDELLGRWQVLEIVDDEGIPDSDSDEHGWLTFTSNGVLEVERLESSLDDPNSDVQTYPIRIERTRIILDVDGDYEFGEYWFEDDVLVIRDTVRKLNAYLRQVE